jgi:hypothetical protein
VLTNSKGYGDEKTGAELEEAVMLDELFTWRWKFLQDDGIATVRGTNTLQNNYLVTISNSAFPALQPDISTPWLLL